MVTEPLPRTRQCVKNFTWSALICSHNSRAVLLDPLMEEATEVWTS